MAISRKLIGILTVSAIGLVALGTSAQNAVNDTSRKAAPKKTSSESGGVEHDDDWRERNSKGNTSGRTWVSGDPVDLNLRKKEGGSHKQEKVQYQDFDFSNHTQRNTPTTLPAGSNEWETQRPNSGDLKVVTHNKHPETRAKAKTKNRRRN